MGIKLYDDAIIKKIQKWIPEEQKLKILKPDQANRLFNLKADENNDEPLTLPMIAVSRDPSVGIDIPGRRNLSCDGVKLDGSKDCTIQLDAIPINISYQIDVYTQKYYEGDDYIRSLIFNIINHPRMKVLIPYNNINIKHVCYLWLQSQVTDNSDIAEKLFADEFTRWTIRVDVHDAFIFGAPVVNNAKIVGVELEVKDRQPGDDIITVEYDYSKDANNLENDDD